jgi:hypothetical protein
VLFAGCGVNWLQRVEKSKSGRPSERKAAANTAGMSERQRKTALRVANISATDLEESVDNSGAGLLHRGDDFGFSNVKSCEAICFTAC